MADLDLLDKVMKGVLKEPTQLLIQEEAVEVVEWKAVDKPEVEAVEKSVVLVAGVRTSGERDHRRRQERGDPPAEHLEDALADQHHREGDRARRRREGAHGARALI